MKPTYKAISILIIVLILSINTLAFSLFDEGWKRQMNPDNRVYDGYSYILPENASFSTYKPSIGDYCEWGNKCIYIDGTCYHFHNYKGHFGRSSYGQLECYT